MKNIKISFLCVIIFTTTAYCTENSENQEPKQQTDATFDKQKSKKQTNTTFIQKILDSKHDKKSTEEQTNSNDQEAKRPFTVKEKVEIVASIALILFFAATVKYTFFPNEKQKKLQSVNGPHVGITGMSNAFEIAAISLVGQLIRSL